MVTLNFDINIFSNLFTFENDKTMIRKTKSLVMIDLKNDYFSFKIKFGMIIR